MALALVKRIGIGVCGFGSFRIDEVEDSLPLAYDTPSRDSSMSTF